MKIFLILLLIILVGCESNPYPELGNSGESRRTSQDDGDPRDEEETRIEPLALSILNQMDFKEGRKGEYQFKAEVKAPGKPLVWIDNLPAGATFDDKNLVITWAPGFFDGNDPKDPSIKVRTYVIQVNLRSSNSVERQLSEKVILKVSDTPRTVDISSSNSVSVYEGKTLTYDFDISNKDYPNGPFRVVTSDMPANTKLSKISDTKYRVEFSPDYYYVNRDQDGSRIEHTSKIVVTNPAGHIGEKQFDITVYDERLGVNLQTPNTAQTPVLEQGLDASFQIAAYDLNKEISPSIEFTSSRPNFGKFTAELIENADSYSSVYNVKWNDIPPAYNGKTIDIGFKACVLDDSGWKNNCSYETLKIAIKVKDRKSPIIDRSAWPVGELIYLGFNKTETRNLKITDGEDPRITPTVEIFPKKIRKFVSISSGRIFMKIDEPGVHQFHVKATSDYKTSTTESFIVEVFPEDRSKVLFFADSTRDPEVKFYKENLSDVSVMNPLLQTINLRAVKERETLVLGTSVLYDKGAELQILKAMKEIKNLVIASPLMRNMPDKFLNELNVSYNMKFIGRYNDISNAPKIEDTYFATTTQFQTPMHQVKLGLRASSESFNPLVFSGGLDNPNKNCKSVMGITPNGFSPYVLGVVCSRSGGGRLVLLGTEWADLKVHADDKAIPATWFNTMLKGRF